MTLFDRAVSLALPAIPRPIVGYFSRRYIAGPTVEHALRVVRALASEGAMATLDILGEFISTPEEARENTRAYERLVQRIRADGLKEANISVKLTALGLAVDPALCLDNLRELMRVVVAADSFVRVDMEDSSCTSGTLDVYRRLRAEFPGRIGVVLQARLRRTLDDVDALCAEPSNFRLCKGIYLEPRRLAFTDAEIIRRNFTLILERMLEHGAYVGIATHDELLVWEALRLLRRHGLTRERYEFQMLLGVDEELRRILIEAGHRLRVYVPFGDQWYPYSVRRLRENPQLAGYAFKALFQRPRVPTPAK
ncbi:MAG TPA: proline dehydrogenase family protein [Candidatus Polarisedimenticolaceae bacterium]|nr:proline dehydrogenase family protein [Candidatus Polarisedimenticolaceae bacterium]